MGIKMQKKLFLSYILLVAVVLSISLSSFWKKGYQYIYQQSENYYLLQAEMLGDAFENREISGSVGYKSFVEEYSQRYKVRITLIDGEGNVLADTSGEEVTENHKTRKEIAKALQGESVTVSRYSTTMGMDYSYSAVPVEKDGFKGVLRISLPLNEMNGLDENLTSSIGGALFIAIVLAIVLAAILAKVLTRPINEITEAAGKISAGDYSTKIYIHEDGQMGKLADSFNTMTSTLKNTMAKVSQRNMELEAMLSSMASGVVAIDEGNAVLFYNEPFLKIVENTTSRKIVNKSLYNIVRNAVIFEAIDGVREKGTTQVREGSLITGNGKLIRVTAAPLVIAEGKTIGVLLVVDDVTKVKKLESIRSDFVSNVTHELKTPLTSIRGFIDTLKHGAINDELVARKFLDIIDIEAERLYSLIQDILLLSEIESKKDSEKSPCNLNYCIEEVIELLAPKLSGDVEIHYDPEPYIKPYRCNPDRMKQLIINLLDNAIKYTEKGNITIKCKEEKEKLMIQVSDTGIGMENDQLSRIFERFYRVDKGRGRKQGGTGLGLSIVKHIVELYGGNIRVESKVNEGTTFEIKLPY